MISFITDYDDNTKDNLTLFNNLRLAGFSVALHSKLATNSNLYTELSTRDENCFAMSHGDIDVLKDQNGDNAFNEKVLDIDKKFSVFAYACNTSAQLGRLASNRGITWLGYKSPINAPCIDHEMVDIYIDIFSYICTEFPNVNCPKSASSFLQELKVICDKKIDQLYDMRESASYEAGISTHMNMRELWQNLTIWLESSEKSIEHPQNSTRW